VGRVSDFLLELLSEEIPARMQERARADLARLFEGELGKAGLKAGRVETFSTPRRLALIARELPAETEAVREELKGPRTSAPPQALEGFLRKTGRTQDQLTDRDGVYFAVIDKPGRATAAVLAEAIPAIVRAFPWPKSLRWGAASQSTESLRWVRPLQGVVALLGEEIVEFEIDGITSGAATVGHRFHHPGRITIGSTDDYATKLRACHVIIDHEEREALIATAATTIAAQPGLTLVRDEALLKENAGLTEWPVPLLGSFDPAFLAVPPEVIQLTMATNQKYFACLDREGRLAPNFVCTANIEAHDRGAAIVAGNQKVLAARLSDAKFFWEQDLKVPLEEQAKKLDQIVFHEKLGTVADKVERVAKLARWLVEEGVVKPSPTRGEAVSELAEMAETAARLCKADLVTGMVGEFPELQGVMGGYYARAQGYSNEVADAIRDHYKPVGQGDEVPTAPVTVAVSLADKLDTLFSFYYFSILPTGSKDPFALRRTELSIISLVLINGIRESMSRILYLASKAFHDGIYLEVPDPALAPIIEETFVGFLRNRAGLQTLSISSNDERVVNSAMAIWHATESMPTRLKVQQREAGVRHDLIDAVFALGGEDDLVRLLARVKALQAFVETAEGRDLLAGYKRAANILKKEAWGHGAGPSPARHPGLDPGSTFSSEAEPEGRWMPDQVRHDEVSRSSTAAPEQLALIAALDAAEPRARAAVEREDFEGAMQALATLRAPVDAFFDKVTVNDPDPAKRAARLDLLARMRDAVHQVADFSKIEG
jgi:glycyl-tRNA synthetase beta chain